MALPRLIYWKWDDDTIENAALRRARLDDLCNRSCFSHIYVSLVWCSKDIDCPQALDAIADAACHLRARGRWLVLDIDVRPLRAQFAQAYPDALQGLCTTGTVVLDDQGNGQWETRCGESGDHYGTYRILGSRLLAAFAFQPAGPYAYVPESLERVEDACIATSDTPGQLTVRIAAPGCAGRTVVLYALHTFEYPDVFSSAMTAFHDALLAACESIPLGGAAIDEWGFFPYPGFGFRFAWRDPWYSEGMARAARMRTGRDFVQDCFSMVWVPTDNHALRTRAINDYYALIRHRMRDIETRFYERVKTFWGPDAFVGVHPTWYAIEPILYSSVELWKNGLDWWEVPRDFGQTDEYCPYAVRTALARRCGGPVWYNMWYGMGSNDVGTFLAEIRRGIRYGGRLHALSYRCPREKEVMELGNSDALDAVSSLLARVQLLDEIQDNALDCRLLVVLGYGAAIDWTRNTTAEGYWRLGDDVLASAYRTVNALWQQGLFCDLVPSTEIDAGRLQVDEMGNARYCGHRYDLCVWIGADGLTAPQAEFLNAIAVEQLFVCGTAVQDRDGRPLGSRLLDRLRVAADRPEEQDAPSAIPLWAVAMGLSAAPAPNAGVFTDGLVVFTAGPDTSPAGTPLSIHCTWQGRIIQAACEDFFAIRLDEHGGVERLAAPQLKECRIDDQPVLPHLWGADVAHRRLVSP